MQRIALGGPAVGWFCLLAFACAAGPKRESTADRAARGDTCASVAQPRVNAQTSERLTAAGNILEYQSVWLESHPGASLGSLDHSQLRAFLRSKGEEIHACYEAVLDELPDGRGRVVARFVIERDGSAPHVSIDGRELFDPTVGCCLAKRIAQWTFPSPINGEFVAVEYPFVVRVSHGP